MMFTTALRLRSGIVVALAILILPTVCAAGTISMFLTDFDVTYLGSAPASAGVPGAIYDAISINGANGAFNTNDADELQAASFKLDQTALGTLVDSPVPTGDDMWGDLRVNGIGGSIPRNTVNAGLGNDDGTFGFDWFLKPKNNGGGVGFFLRLGLTNLTVTLTDLPPGAEAFTFSGLGTVLSQNLPFGVAFDTSQKVAFSYTAPKAGLSGGNPSTAAIGSGAITITGVQIPEPAPIALLGTGGLMLGIGVVRRNGKRRVA